MQQTCVKRVWDLTQLGDEGDPLRIVKEIESCSYQQIVYAQTRYHPREFLRYFDIQTDPLILTGRPDLLTVNKILKNWEPA